MDSCTNSVHESLAGELIMAATIHQIGNNALVNRVVQDGVELLENISVCSRTQVIMVDRFVNLMSDVYMGFTTQDLTNIKVSILYRLKISLDQVDVNKH